jgi:adenylosuccinate lyase
MAAWENRRDFRAELEKDAEIARLLTKQQLDELFDPDFYLRNVDVIFARVFGRA